MATPCCTKSSDTNNITKSDTNIFQVGTTECKEIKLFSYSLELLDFQGYSNELILFTATHGNNSRCKNVDCVNLRTG